MGFTANPRFLIFRPPIFCQTFGSTKYFPLARVWQNHFSLLINEVFGTGLTPSNRTDQFFIIVHQSGGTTSGNWITHMAFEVLNRDLGPNFKHLLGNTHILTTYTIIYTHGAEVDNIWSEMARLARMRIGAKIYHLHKLRRIFSDDNFVKKGIRFWFEFVIFKHNLAFTK